MSLQPLPGFRPLETQHCVTGSLRHVYLYNDHDLSEELLLGIGGGLFRYMFGHFLQEAAAITDEDRLQASAAAFQRIGDRWQEVAAIFKQGWEADDPTALLPQTTAPLQEIADLEEEAWRTLSTLVREHQWAS